LSTPDFELTPFAGAATLIRERDQLIDTMQGYLDAARLKHGLHTDRALARAIKIRQPLVSYWRSGKQLPDDDHMVSVALFAGEDPGRALLLLNIWRATSERVALTYRALLPASPGSAIVIHAKRIRQRVADSPETSPKEEHPSLFGKTRDRVVTAIAALLLFSGR
jgi:hypothetical protein